MSDRSPAARPEDVFSCRASFYATSKVHDDKETLSWLLEAAAPRPDDVALDVGTGAGHTALAMAPLVRHVEAIDVTTEMLEEGRKLCRQRGITNVRFLKGDATSLPFPDSSYDIVTCRRAAHHFVDVRMALSEMVRVLRPGGKMIIDDRSVPEDNEVDALINRLDKLHDPSHVRDYRQTEWSALIAGAGLELQSARPYRKRLTLAHFTKMVDEATAGEMHKVIDSAPDQVKAEVALDNGPGGPSMDNFFILLSAVKPR